MPRNLGIDRKIKGLVPPASRELAPAEDSIDFAYGRDDRGRVKLSAAIDPDLAEHYKRYLVTLSIPGIVDPDTNQYRVTPLFLTLYSGDLTDEAVVPFHETAWVLGAPYKHHGSATYLTTDALGDLAVRANPDFDTLLRLEAAAHATRGVETRVLVLRARNERDHILLSVRGAPEMAQRVAETLETCVRSSYPEDDSARSVLLLRGG